MNFIFKKIACCICLFVISTVIYAETAEQTPILDRKETQQTIDLTVRAPEQNTVEDVDAEKIKAKTDSEVEKESLDERRIVRRENPVNPCDRGLDDYRYEKSWYDHTQVYINSRFCEPALWFDNFFSTDRLFDEGVAGTYVRWRNDFTYDEEEYFKFKMRLNLSVVLPGFKDRLRLTFQGEEDEDLRDIAPGNGDTTSDSLGLQLDIKENARSKFNVKLNLSPRIRFRYRYTYPIYQDITLRLTQEVQWKDGTNSARARFDFEQALRSDLLFRASTEARVSEEYDGVDWLQAFVLYRWLNKKSSLAYESSVNGITEPMSKTTNYRIGVRFRKNFHREWLFYEIAPEITWPITLDQQREMIITDRRSKWQIFFRLEMHFGNAYKKRYQDYNRL